MNRVKDELVGAQTFRSKIDRFFYVLLAVSVGLPAGIGLLGASLPLHQLSGT